MRPTRIHVAIGVSDLESSKSHYSKILKSQPTRIAIDQIDWILDSPPLNLSIFYNPERLIGIEHMGFDLPAAGLESAIVEAGGESVMMDPDNVRFELFSSD